ncbi:histidine phosphatase family protein [Mucilaginibacter auburnensis]|uniref:Histidine phosphatase superfamily protein (Branch 1) n=1 Tax=Mucilaginibacter auburnensis TaxID=1457233 RepID=A0A2H9VS89_9SPHI|nr:histidine phosphatase family protein [Mucilaginibacter auburnensis]PJJ83693.1 histidine phosphatase superfamily protein (branch 1) [Mucilaginibacter auburnensis]
MKTNASTIGLFKVFLFCVLLSNFNAFAQKTFVWIVMPGETVGKQDYLNSAGQARAEELAKILKREKIQAIYTIDSKAAQQTANPLAQKAKVSPQVYADSIAALADKIKKNFHGNKVLVIAKAANIIPLLKSLGVKAPFSAVQNDDNDLLFALTLNTNSDKAELFINHYGKAQHSTEIPQQFILENFYPSFVPPMNNH